MSKLDSLIRQDVEAGTFRSQNIYDDEYLTPMFYSYCKLLESENEILKQKVNELEKLNHQQKQLIDMRMGK